MQVMFGWQETQEKIKKEDSANSQKKTQVLIFYISKSQKSKETNVNKLTSRKKKEVQKRNTPSEKKKKREEKERLVYDVRFETGEICEELLWVRN